MSVETTEKKQFSVIWLLQPILIALFPVTHMYARNPEEVLTLHFIFAATTIVLGTLFVFLICSLLYKSFFKGALATNLLVILCYSLTHMLHKYLAPISIRFFHVTLFGARVFRVRYMLFIITILFLILAHRYIVQKLKSDFLLKLFFFPLLIFFAIDLSNGISVRNKLAHLKINYIESNKNFRTSTLKQLQADPVKARPDVYFIILDAYPGQEYLVKNNNFDNEDFFKKLEERGFYVCKNGISNYRNTAPSLAATLNMQYLSTTKEQPLTHMWQDNNVAHFFKKLGYRYFEYCKSPGRKEYPSKGFMKDLVEELSNFFFRHLYFTQVFLFSWIPFYQFFTKFYDQNLRTEIKHLLSDIKQKAHIEGPKYVYAHFHIPHGPHVFDRNGNSLILDNVHSDKRSAYGEFEEILYINKKIINVIDYLQKNSKTQPVIILQADHGSHLVEPDTDPHFNILNAYYLPDGGEKLLYQTITPVNNFRLIFNHYFGIHLPLLEDTIYAGCEKFSKIKTISKRS